MGYPQWVFFKLSTDKYVLPPGVPIESNNTSTSLLPEDWVVGAEYYTRVLLVRLTGTSQIAGVSVADFFSNMVYYWVIYLYPLNTSRSGTTSVLWEYSWN